MSVPSSPGRPHSSARVVRAVVASVFVAGIAALVAFEASTVDVAPAATTSSTAPAFLRAPAADPSLPSAEQVFASRSTAEDAAAPTF